MSIFFVDANILLDFYSSGRPELQKLLVELLAVGDDLFITEQVVSEVNRNKLKKAGEAVQKALEGFRGRAPGLPVHLSTDGGASEFQQRVRKHQKALAVLSTEAETQGADILREVSRSVDPVSNALLPIFQKAVQSTPAVAKAANQRRLVGNPPGKQRDPLGDQLSWESLLARYDGGTGLDCH